MRTVAPPFVTALAIALLASTSAQAEIAWQNNLRTAHAEAQKQGKLLLLHFYSDNCTWCEKLEAGSFKAPQVGAAIHKNFVPVKVHANSSPKLAAMFKVNRFPTDVIVTTEGQTLAHKVSPQDPDRYVAMLTGTLNGLPAKQPATQIAQATQPASATMPAPTNPPASSAPVPGYAASPAPTSEATIEAPTPELTTPSLDLPDTSVASLPTGPQATLTGSRGGGLTLEMPAQTEAMAAPAVTKATESFQKATEPFGEASAAVAKANEAVAETSANVENQLDSAVASVTTAVDEVIEDVSDTAPAAKDIEIDGEPELAMQGFCPVTVIGEDKWVEGSADYGVIHLGKLYLFTSEENMNRFLADPVPFTPVLNGIDVVRFFEERKIVPGKREWGLKDPNYNRMFFFADEAAMEHFYNQYERYTDAAIEVMDKAVKDANPGT